MWRNLRLSLPRPPLFLCQPIDQSSADSLFLWSLTRQKPHDQVFLQHNTRSAVVISHLRRDVMESWGMPRAIAFQAARTVAR